MKLRFIFFLIFLLKALCISTFLFAEETSVDYSRFKNDPAFRLDELADDSTSDSNETGVTIDYGEHGFEVKTNDGRFSAWVGLRGQFRLSYPFDDDPITLDDFDANDEYEFSIRRARLKWGGHALGPWIDYYTEYDIVNGMLLDFRLTIVKRKDIQVRFGQWKAEYNRERRDSSGELQFVDRSIVNRVFTIDRQPGFMVMGRLFAGKRADSRYFVGLFSGEGAGNFSNEGTPMVVGRYQWNFLKRDLEFSQSDVDIREEPAASLAFGAIRNRSRFTRFSGSGGGELEGFTSDVAERYDIVQMLAEFAYQHRGLALQSEYHWKEIEDRVLSKSTDFEGGYAQAGYFLHALNSNFPRALELAFRAAFVNGEQLSEDAERRELTWGANWFMNKHRNKITLDISRLSLNTPPGDDSGWRARLQWDLSI